MEKPVHIQIFEEFIKYHEPNFHKNEHFCWNIRCSDCLVYSLCESLTANSDGGLSIPEMEYIKQKYPEYFI